MCPCPFLPPFEGNKQHLWGNISPWLASHFVAFSFHLIDNNSRQQLEKKPWSFTFFHFSLSPPWFLLRYLTYWGKKAWWLVSHLVPSLSTWLTTDLSLLAFPMSASPNPLFLSFLSHPYLGQSVQGDNFANKTRNISINEKEDVFVCLLI